MSDTALESLDIINFSWQLLLGTIMLPMVPKNTHNNMLTIQNWIDLKDVILNYLGLGNKCWIEVLLWKYQLFRVLFEIIWPQNNIINCGHHKRYYPFDSSFCASSQTGESLTYPLSRIFKSLVFPQRSNYSSHTSFIFSGGVTTTLQSDVCPEGTSSIGFGWCACSNDFTNTQYYPFDSSFCTSSQTTVSVSNFLQFPEYKFNPWLFWLILVLANMVPYFQN